MLTEEPLQTIPRSPNKPQWIDLRFYTRPYFKPASLLAPYFEGWDTETIQHPKHPKHLRGNTFLLCNTQTDHPVSSHDDFMDALPFLLLQGKGKINAWWNIDYDVRTLFKWDHKALMSLYPEYNGQGELTLFDNRHNQRTETDLEEYHLTYTRRKKLSISSKKRTAHFYDASLFYRQTLASAAKRYLKREPHELKEHRANDLYSHYLTNPTEVTSYCIWDATATRDLMALFFSKLHKMDFYPREPMSSGYLAADYLLSTTDYPHMFKVESTINSAAYESYRGGWIDSWKRGTMTCYKYDINAAYPWAMLDLPDTRDGYWVDEIVKEAPLGFVLIQMTQSPHSPTALAAWMKTVHGYPWLDIPVKAWITIQEYNSLLGCEGINLKSLAAHCFIPTPNARKPFLVPVTKLNDYKNRYHPKRGIEPDDGAYLAAKEMVNSMYGKTVQKIYKGDHWQAGKLFNPVYASTITAKCRVLVLEAIKNHLKDIISISTDCIATTKPLNDLPLDDVEPGKWKLECENAEGLFIFPGIYEIKGKATHNRGFRITTCVCGHVSKEHWGPCKACSTCENFQPSLTRLVKDTQGASMEIRYEKPYGVREAYRMSDMDMVGVFEARLYEKGLESARRLWLEEPQTFQDLLTHEYSSIPLPVSFILPHAS